MRLHRFYIDDELEGKNELDIADIGLIHQWRDVLRLKPGEAVILFGGNGVDYVFDIVSIGKNNVALTLRNTVRNVFAPKRKVILFQSIIKKDNLEWILEKGTELGISEFVPVLSDRSEKKFFNKERLEKILKESTEQSGRGQLPVLHGVVTLTQAVSSCQIPALVFDGTGMPIDSIISKSDSSDLAIFVGPEGGWSEQDLKIFKDKNIRVVSLGAMTLRAETAAIAISALCLLR